LYSEQWCLLRVLPFRAGGDHLAELLQHYRLKRSCQLIAALPLGAASAFSLALAGENFFLESRALHVPCDLLATHEQGAANKVASAAACLCANLNRYARPT
jgi:hypothetical protein